MKIRNIGIIGILTLLVVSGCKDVLDKRELEAIDENIWSDETQTVLFLNGLYTSNMPGMSLGEFSGYTEESYTGSSSVTDLMYGVTDETEKTSVSEMSVANYGLVRRLNICIEGVNSGTLDDTFKGQITGQAYFFRALRYWHMLRYYGGISIVNYVQDIYSDELDVPRSTTKVSIEAIVKDLDYAIANLPVEWTSPNDLGRITKGAAAAYKGRILLNWASPLFNPENKVERWQAAYEANEEAIKYLSEMSVPRALNPNFANIFIDDVQSNPEAVLFRTFDASINYSSAWEGTIRPSSGGGGNGQKPTWELVRAFPMSNGMMTGEEKSGFDSVMYWLNRDPRFYHTISYTGDTWEMNGRSTITNNLNTNYVATYARPNGIEGIRSTSNQGFLCRKASNSNVEREFTGLTSTTWHELRYAEVLMNLAECANETEQYEVMLDNLKLIRGRAGFEQGENGNYGFTNTSDKVWMREVIMNERLVEFAYEGKRYWDLRRRLMYRNDLGLYTKKLNGLQRHTVRLKPKSPYTARISNGTYAGMYRIDTVLMLNKFNLNSIEDYNTYFTREFVPVDSPTGSSTGVINYRELYDFFGIPNGILEKSPAVEQTLGWLFGTFDPLEE